MREFCRQVEAEVVSKSKNKIHETWGPPISGALYMSPLLPVSEVRWLQHGAAGDYAY